MNHLFSLAMALFAAGGVGCVSSSELRRLEYDAQYQNALKMCGHPDAAYQAGYNAGYGGNQMRGEWAAMCVPETRAEASAAYQTGFVEGARNAPARVVHTVRQVPGTARMRSTTTVSECTFDSDCGSDGWRCRDHTCMGYGSLGERCVFNSDCLSDSCLAGTCRE